MRGYALLPVVALLLHSIAPGAGAQAPPPPLGRVELFGGVTLVGSSVDTSLVTSYAPPFLNALATASRAGQTLQLQGENGIGLEFGAGVFFTEAVGVQVLFGTDSQDLGGSNGTHSAHLEYIQRMPPDYTPRPAVVDRVAEWPNTGGELKQRTLSVNLAGRGRLGRNVVGQVSGGLSYYRVTGPVSPLGYAVFQLGGHSTLGYFVYEMESELGPASTFGFNAGGSLDILLGRTAALTADFRYFGGGSLSAPVTIVEVLNQDEVLVTESLASIQQNLQPPAVELSPRRVRLAAGLKLRF